MRCSDARAGAPARFASRPPARARARRPTAAPQHGRQPALLQVLQRRGVLRPPLRVRPGPWPHAPCQGAVEARSGLPSERRCAQAARALMVLAPAAQVEARGPGPRLGAGGVRHRPGRRLLAGQELVVHPLGGWRLHQSGAGEPRLRGDVRRPGGGGGRLRSGRDGALMRPNEAK